MEVEIIRNLWIKEVVQGHMFTCWEIMLIYGTNVFLVQKSLLIKKNFGANFFENVHHVFFTYMHGNIYSAESAIY